MQEGRGPSVEAAWKPLLMSEEVERFKDSEAGALLSTLPLYLHVKQGLRHETWLSHIAECGGMGE